MYAIRSYYDHFRTRQAAGCSFGCVEFENEEALTVTANVKRAVTGGRVRKQLHRRLTAERGLGRDYCLPELRAVIRREGQPAAVGFV